METKVLKSLVGKISMLKLLEARVWISNVEILETSSQFYNGLLQGVQNAHLWVVNVLMYIGTGTLEQGLATTTVAVVALRLELATVYSISMSRRL
jgi:hypothetical protein